MCFLIALCSPIPYKEIMEEYIPQLGRMVYTPPNGPPPGVRPNQEIYQHMGRDNIFKMCEDFYTLLGQSAISHMFPDTPEGLKAASQRQAMFMSGALGGPPLYAQIIGPPRMRARHLPFVIDNASRLEWLRCFKKVLEIPEIYDFPADDVAGFIYFLEGFSAWMVNKETPSETPHKDQDASDSADGASQT